MTDPVQFDDGPPLLSGDELYDMLMGSIEPELTTAAIEKLPAQYANETPANRKERADRYARAFAEYDRRYSEYQSRWSIQYADYKRQALASLENDERADEASVDLANIEAQMRRS